MRVLVNGGLREVEPATTLADLLADRPGEGAPRGIAVAVDGEVVPRAQHGDTTLHEGARVEIVTAVQGG